MFEQYPKKRPPLTKEIEEIYLAHYRLNREGGTSAGSLSKKMESWLHKQVADDVAGHNDSGQTTLELGAGTLNQLQYEPVTGPYDIVEPFKELYDNSPRLERVRNIFTDISDIPDSFRYDRITSVATLEHLCNLPEIVARAGLLLSEHGVMRASIPSEGTILWGLGWRLTTGIDFRLRYGLDYGILRRHDHVNTARDIEEVLEFFFDEVECRVFGLSRAISFYRFYACRKPAREKCREYAGKMK